MKTIYLKENDHPDCHFEPTPVNIKIAVNHYRIEPEVWRHTISYKIDHETKLYD